MVGDYFECHFLLNVDNGKSRMLELDNIVLSWLDDFCIYEMHYNLTLVLRHSHLWLVSNSHPPSISSLVRLLLFEGSICENDSHSFISYVSSMYVSLSLSSSSCSRVASFWEIWLTCHTLYLVSFISFQFEIIKYLVRHTFFYMMKVFI